MDDSDLDMKDLSPEELKAIKEVQWVNENPDKVVWIDGTDFLEKYADKEEN